MDLLLGLKRIKEFDLGSFTRYIDKINDSQDKSNFWGERFEIFVHHKLLPANGHLIKNLRRGKDGEEPDFVFDFNSDKLGIELTTSKFTVPPKEKNHIIKKITGVILDKNRKPYSGEKCALIIDITNLVTYSSMVGLSLKRLFQDEFHGFSYLGTKIKYGMIILCNSVYCYRPDETLFTTLNPYFGLMVDNGIVDSNLNSFIRTFFNKFKTEENCELSHYHLNI